MKTLKLFALVGIFSVFFAIQPTVASRPEQINLDEPQNYVVIGAFKIHRNAVRFSDHAQSLSLNAKYEKNVNRNLYYVYVLQTADRAAAIAEANRLRSESEFTDSWVYSGSFTKETAPAAVATRSVDVNPATEEKIETVQPKDPEPVATTVTTPPETTPTEQPASQSIDDGGTGKSFFFKIYRATDSDVVQGDVSAIDVDRTRKMGTYKGNAPVKVADPLSKTDSVLLVCEVFGYRKSQRNIYYNEPSGEGIETDANGAVVVPFELIRLKKGDIAVMYHVYFYKDASIMRPESRYEVESLLKMLNENKNYRIRIHGHTNGGASGKIISKPKDGDNFFSLTGSVEGFGTAKKLSEERAEIIRDFLLKEGIDPSRMETKAWAGKRPIYDKLSSRAQENVRVEIEILQE
ncbi:OmpA family protein [Ohtaekwangia kribbensis]|jgi:outer membrane protein OmpA-like peptidoglycan-associated protein|uniref:OmpA family protein n=1 Tax=Ohtaekwangia kribbensis TaxID=688913 RepID=A0ABW3K352_9BACT